MNNITELWEDIASTEPKPNCSNNSGSVPNVITCDTKLNSTPPQCENIGTEKKWTKKCPTCGIEMGYSSANCLTRAIKQNSICKKCDGENKRLIIPPGGWKKKCPKCDKEQTYSLRSNFLTAIKNNWICQSCRYQSSEYKEKLRKSQVGIPSIKIRKRPFEAIFNELIRNSKYRKIPCDMTYDEYIGFTRNSKCHYCQSDIHWNPYQTDYKRRKVGSNLDRKDSAQGYTTKNCVVCCKVCNSVKNNFFSYEDMIKLGNTIREIKEQKTCKK